MYIITKIFSCVQMQIIVLGRLNEINGAGDGGKVVSPEADVG